MNKTTLLISSLSLGAIGINLILTQPSFSQDVNFTCTVDTDNVPITFAQTPDGATPVFKWTSTFFKPPYTPMQRCQEVSERMNKFYAQGALDSMTSGIVNKLPVICAGASCNGNGTNVLITLKPNQNPNQVLQELEANRSGAGGPSYQLGGGSTGRSGSSSLQQNADGTVTLNLKQFLANRSSATMATPQNRNFQPITPTNIPRSW